MNRLNEFIKLFDSVVDIKKEQNIICSSGVATALFDHPRFSYLDNGLKILLTPLYYKGEQHTVGFIYRTRIIVEPGIEFNDMNIYDNKFKRLFNFKSEKNIKLEDIL